MFKRGDKIQAISDRHTDKIWREIMGRPHHFRIKIGKIYTVSEVEAKKTNTDWDKMGYLLYIEHQLVHPDDFAYPGILQMFIKTLENEIEMQ